MYIRSRVPLRISFAGGGTDVSPYCDLYGGFVINATINRFATVKLKIRNDEQICVKSLDYDISINYDLNSDFVYDGQLDLVKKVIQYIKKEFSINKGFDLHIQNDAPPGSGLGSSSAIVVAILGAFKEYLNLALTPYDIAELAYKIERIDLGIKGGRQDQYATAFGGFNFMEFYNNRAIINPLKLRSDIVNELTHSLVIAYIGGSHNSSTILEKQIANVNNKNADALDAMYMQKELAIKMKNMLVLGKLGKFGQLLDEGWSYKKKMANGITNNKIDDIYEFAKKNGAIGGKISGAGGGGFMFFFADIDKKYDVIKALKQKGAEIINYTFENHGLFSWKIDA